MANNRHIVFVYGSLKIGFGNNRLLQRTGSKYIDDATTYDSSYRMISLGGFPGLYKDGRGKINGEVYVVNDIGLKALDRLESNGSFYLREQIDVYLENRKSVVEAWTYFLIDPDYEDREHGVKESSNEHGTTCYSWVSEMSFSDFVEDDTDAPAE